MIPSRTLLRGARLWLRWATSNGLGTSTGNVYVTQLYVQCNKSQIFIRGLSDDSNFRSLLPKSNAVSPFADPSRTIKAAPVTQAVFLSLNTPINEPPPPQAQKVVVEEPKAMRVEETIKYVASSSSAGTELAAKRTGVWQSFKDRFGLSIDPNASDEEKKRQRMARNTKIGSIIVFGGSFVGFIIFCLYYGRADRDSQGHVIRDQYSGSIFAPFYRIYNSFQAWRDYVVEPSRDKLLPDPLPAPYLQPKYTLVIEMKNVLVAPEWTYKTGYRFKKRPALDYFLDVVGYPNFEVVIYTSESSMSAPPIVDSFDPNQRIMYRLYRDCTKYKNGHHIKDLSKLNRDLKKVIHIDFDPKSCSLNPENVLRVPKWDGDMSDTALVDLAELLKTIHLTDVDDVRDTLQYYSSFDDPAKEFRRRAIYLAEQEAAMKAQAANQDQGLLKRYSGRLFGFRRHATN